MKTKFRLLSLITALLICVSCFSSSVFAGVNDSAAGSGGGGSGGANSIWKIGPDYDGWLLWAGFTGTTTLTSVLWPGSSLTIPSCQKGAYVQLHVPTANTWLRWDWWYKYAPGSPKSVGSWWGENGSIWDPNNQFGQKNLKGQLPDPDLVTEATKNGFSYDSNLEQYYNSTNKKYLDAVWVEGWQETSSTPMEVITYISFTNPVDGSTSISLDNTSSTAEYLYKNPVTSSTYYNKTLPNEEVHDRILTVFYTTVTKDSTFMTDGTNVWNVVDTYTKNGNKVDTSEFHYKTEDVSIDQVYYTPYDLNRNGPATTTNLKNTYPSFTTSSGNLNMSVDNKQNIIDGTSLKSLDTNMGIEFNITFNNGQFGIPTKSEGGFDISTSRPYDNYLKSNGTYNSSLLPVVGIKGSKNTGAFNQEIFKANTFGTLDPIVWTPIVGQISNPIYWGGSMCASLNSNKSSLTYSSDEFIGVNEIKTFPRGWMGGDFLFKTTTMGTYYLYNAGRNFWEVNYQMGEFYTYGIEYSGTITVSSGISNATIGPNPLYVGIYSKTAIQPILRGDITAKTVSGDIG